MRLSRFPHRALIACALVIPLAMVGCSAGGVSPTEEHPLPTMTTRRV